jgi:hypothetical protein
MKIFATIGDVVMEFGYLNLCFLPVLRILLFLCGSALPYFQMTIPRLPDREAWGFWRFR